MAVDSLHLTTVHGPTDTRIFDKEATSLSEAGFNVGILAHSTPGESRNGIDFFNLGTAPTRTDRWQHIPKTANIARRLDAAVYHFHDPELIPVGLYLAETTNGSVVYDVHEDYGHKFTGREWIPNIIARPSSYLFPRLEKIVASRFDAIVSATDQIEKRFEKSNEYTTTLYNFPRTEGIPTQPNIKERQAEYVLCYVGGLSELRGIHRGLELLDTLRNRGVNAELWALGNWRTEADKQQAEEFIRNRNIGSYVHFPGYLDYEEMFKYLYSADVGLSLLDTTEFQNSIPTKQFEYLYAGLPIITTPLDAAIRFLPESFRYIVPQGDSEATANAVENALKHNYDTTEMQSLVKKKYSWENEGKKLINLYKDLLNRQ